LISVVVSKRGFIQTLDIMIALTLFTGLLYFRGVDIPPPVRECVECHDILTVAEATGVFTRNTEGGREAIRRQISGAEDCISIQVEHYGPHGALIGSETIGPSHCSSSRHTSVIKRVSVEGDRFLVVTLTRGWDHE